MNIDTSHLPPVNGLRFTNATDALNADIITAIHKAFPAAVKQVAAFAQQFKRSTHEATAFAVWQFLKNKITYKQDPDYVQWVKMPNVLISEGTGDCKSYSLCAASILAALGYPVAFRYAGYIAGRSIPTHVYVITGRIICDGVYSKFNQQKHPAFYKDYPMEVVTLSGIGTINGKPLANKTYAEKLQFILSNAKHPDGIVASIVSKELSKVTGQRYATRFASQHDIAAYKGALNRVLLRSQRKGSIIHVLAQRELDAINAGSHDGVIAGIGRIRFKNIIKKAAAGVKKAASGVKKVALAGPRGAFMALVAMNFAGLGKNLDKFRTEKPEQYKSFWKKWGGNLPSLDKAVTSGKHIAQKKKGVNGIGVVPPVAAAVITAATPILVYAIKMFGGEKAKSLPAVSARDAAIAAADIAELAGMSKEDADKLRDGAKLLPDETPEINNPDDVEITDKGKETGFNLSPTVMIGGAAALAAIVYFSNKKR